MSFIVGPAFFLNASSLVLQDQQSINTFDTIFKLIGDSTVQIQNCTFINSWGKQGAVLNLINSTFHMNDSVMQKVQMNNSNSHTI